MIFLDVLQFVSELVVEFKGSKPDDHPIARVNCYDWTDVCARENITTYPVIHYYRHGGKREQYKHAFDQWQLLRAVRL